MSRIVDENYASTSTKDGRIEAAAPPPRISGSPGRSDTRRLRPVYLNGKFYSGALNGVHRTADRLIRELDRLAPAVPDLDLRLLSPHKQNWAPDFVRIEKIEQRLGHHQVWEQILLPFRAADGVLVNLANLAPVLHGRKLSMMHDAQFLISPESFPRRFRIGYRLLTPMIAATSRRVLTVSEYARDSLAAFGVSPHHKTDVIYNGADHILETPADELVLKRLGLRRERYALLFGTPAVYKNIQVALAAFRDGIPTDVTLVVIGADEATLRAAGLQPPDTAVFAGRPKDAALRALYENALCLLFPSRTEGFGLPPAEAMACGCPVIAAPAGAMPEVCRDAVLYADIFSPEDWAAQVLRLQNQPVLRAAKIREGLSRAEAFTWRKAGRLLMNHILKLAER